MPINASKHIEQMLKADSRHCLIDWACNMLADYDFDGIVVCGASGLLFGPSIADRMNKRIVLVRKEAESTHSRLLVEGYYVKKFFIADDFISSGNTLLWILRNMTKLQPHSQPQGMILYNPPEIIFGNRFQYKINKAKEVE